MKDNVDITTTTSGRFENGILGSARGKKKRAKTETEIEKTARIRDEKKKANEK